jgi:hypothetical protein
MEKPNGESNGLMSPEIIDPIIMEYIGRIRNDGESGKVRQILGRLSSSHVELYRDRIQEKLKDPEWKKYRTTLKLLLLYLD